MKWYFLFCILVFNNSGNAQIKKIIVLEEKFKNLNKWTIESNSPDQFKLKRGSLWIDNTPSLSNKGGNRISRISIRLKTKIACNFQASAIFSFPCMSNSDTTYFLLLSNDAESPLKSIHNYMNITQDMLGLYAVGSGFKDSVDIRVINIQNKFRQIINYNNRIRIPVNKSFDITMKL